MKTIEELKQLNHEQLLSEYSVCVGSMQTEYNKGNIKEATELCWYKNGIFDLIVNRMNK